MAFYAVASGPQENLDQLEAYREREGHPWLVAEQASLPFNCFASIAFGAYETSPRGLIPAFMVVVGGTAFVGCIEPQQPVFAILLVPAAPLALWTCVWGPLARLRGAAAIAAQSIAVLITLAVALILALTGELVR